MFRRALARSGSRDGSSYTHLYTGSVRFSYRWTEPGTYPLWVWAIIFAVFLGLSAWDFDQRHWLWGLVFLGVVLFRLPLEVRAWWRSRFAKRNGKPS